MKHIGFKGGRWLPSWGRLGKCVWKAVGWAVAQRCNLPLERMSGEEKGVWVELRGTVLSGWRVSEREESRLPASQVSASRRKGWSGVHFS